jgi:VWFA-related protein
VDTTAFPAVSVKLSTWDSNGLPITGLSTQDVFIQEDNNTEVHPDSLQANSNTPLSVALVMDVSSSMAGQPLLDAKNAANRFLDKLNETDQAAVIAFSSDVDTDPASLDQKKEIGFSSAKKDAYDLIEGLAAGGGTEVYNAVEKAVKITAQLPAGHRAILLFTDGKNDPPTIGDPESAITLARQENIPIFVIGLGSEIDETYLRRLTSETGGFYRSTPHSSELSDLFNNMATLLKTDYTLTYASKVNEDGQAHAIKIRIASSQGQATVESKIGPVPLATAAPTLAAATPTTQVSATSQPLPTATPVDNESANNNKLFLIIGALVLLMILILVLVTRTKKTKVIEKCTKCGAVLIDEGPCPICKSTERTKVNK